MLWAYAEPDIQQPIWSDIQGDEMDHLVTAILNMGTRSGTVATVARAAVDVQDYVIAGALIAPRFQSTVGIIREGRKKKQMKKGQRRH